MIAAQSDEIPVLAHGLMSLLVWMCNMGNEDDLRFMWSLVPGDQGGIVRSARNYTKNHRRATRDDKGQQSGQVFKNFRRTSTRPADLEKAKP
jgi:hypothetical protein